MKEMIKEKAHNKAFAKIHALEIRVSKLKYDIERKNTGVITTVSYTHLTLPTKA